MITLHLISLQVGVSTAHQSFRYIIYSSNISLLPSVQFSSRWYLCTRKSPYASHPVSQSAIYCDTLHIANALMAHWEPTWPACKIRFQPTLTSRHSSDCAKTLFKPMWHLYSIRWQKWLTETGQTIVVTGLIHGWLTTTKALLATACSLPHLEHTHLHTPEKAHVNTHALSTMLHFENRSNKITAGMWLLNCFLAYTELKQKNIGNCQLTQTPCSIKKKKSQVLIGWEVTAFPHCL